MTIVQAEANYKSPINNCVTFCNEFKTAPSDKVQ